MYVENQPARILDHNSDERLPLANLSQAKQYLGTRLNYEHTSLHARQVNPDLAGQAELVALRPLTASTSPLTQVNTSLALYRSFQFPMRLTLATRFGGSVNFSEDYEFFKAATLGGRQSAYNNTEVCLQIARFRSCLVLATLSIMGFHGVGQVWVPDEAFRSWHRGYSPGLWLAPTPQVVLKSMCGSRPKASCRDWASFSKRAYSTTWYR